MSPPSENSPLLGPADDSTRQETTASSTGHDSLANISNGTFTVPPESVDGAVLERQTSVEERRLRQYEGNKDIAGKMKWIVPAVGLGVLMSAADQTLVVSSYGKIGSDLKELNKTNWIATAYFLTLTSIQPLYGKVSDIFGRKPTLLVTYLIFGVGCVWCGLARTMDELIIARAFAGIGGGGMSTVVSILMSDLVPLKDRGLWQGIINIIHASGSSIGAPLGGILADTIGWRWAFVAQGPICLLAFTACYFVLDLPPVESSHWTAKLRRIDFLGALTLIVAISLLLVGLDRGSNVSWNDSITIATLAVSGPMFALFMFVESKVAAEPFAPGRVVFERSMLAAYLCNFFAFGGFYSVLFYTPLYFQALQALSASQAGIRLVPAIIFGVTGSLGAGFIMRATGKFRLLTIVGYFCLATSIIPLVMFTGGITSSTLGIILSHCYGNLGNGSAVTSSLIALIANADPADQAIATACSYLFRSLGSVLGLSVISSFLQQQLKTKLNARLSAGGSDVDEIVRRVRESLDYINELTPERADIVRQTYGESIRYCFVLIGGITACAFISSIFIREKKLGK